MHIRILLLAMVATGATPALAGSQSSNTSSNSSSNNGVVRERIVDSYCEDGDCVRTIERRVYRDDGRRWRGAARYARDRDWRRDRDDDDD